MKHIENERLIELINFLIFKQEIRNFNQFAIKINANSQSLYDIKHDKCKVSNSILDKSEKTFGISRKYILLGEEPKFISGEYSTNSAEVIVAPEAPTFSVPLLPISAVAGGLNDFVLSVKNSDCEQIISPIKGADFAISVTGESMQPEYPQGSQVLIKKINEKAFIEWGKVYVLDTCNGTVLKKIYPTDDESKIKCVSINSEYLPYDVSLDDIYGIYRVLMLLSQK